MATDAIIIRLKQSNEQEVGDITRVVGLMPARHMADIINVLDLEANPRNSRLGSVTDDIERSIENDENGTGQKLFPLKSKGVLIATSRFTRLDRGRYKLSFGDLSVEGILDGGHNTLAIGRYILDQAETFAGKPKPRKRDVSLWADFKKVWNSERSDIATYLDAISDSRDALKSEGIGTLNFDVPVELLLPLKPEDPECLETFHSSLLEICDARNNNAQLTAGTKGNKEGLFDSFKALFEEKDPVFAKKISWKTNDGGTIDSRSLVALAWIPLSLTTWVEGSDKIVELPKPMSIYSGKGSCLERYLDLMRDPHISSANTNGNEKELHDLQVLSALKVAVDLPKLFDLIYINFPDYYNKDGSYGKITAVKGMQHKDKDKKNAKPYYTPYYGMTCNQPVPDGFIYPLVYGLRACMKRNKDDRIEWALDPFDFIESDEFSSAAADYCGVIRQSDYDPQKVGKGSFSYSAALTGLKLAAIDYRADCEQ